MQVHQFRQIESGPLQHLDFANVDIVEGVDAAASLLDVHGHGVGDQLVDDLLQVDGRDFAGDDVGHLLADTTDLKKKIVF